MHATHIGPVSTSNLSITSTFHIPKLVINLISVGQLCDLGLTVIFSSSGCHVQDPRTRQVIGIGRKVGRMFELVHLRTPPDITTSTLSAAPALSISSRTPPNNTTSTLSAASALSISSQELWHSRLGHVSLDRLKSLISTGRLGKVKSESVSCLSCQLGKQPALSFNKSDSISSTPFDLIHSDVWGPSPHNTMGGSKYFVVFIYDYTRFTWIYLMKNHSELPQLYYNFAQMIQTQFSRSIKTFRADNVMEYK